MHASFDGIYVDVEKQLVKITAGKLWKWENEMLNLTANNQKKNRELHHLYCVKRVDEPCSKVRGL